MNKEKQRLQNLMTYGSDEAPASPSAHADSHNHKTEDEAGEGDRFDEGECYYSILHGV